jgi:hypothetical protein
MLIVLFFINAYIFFNLKLDGILIKWNGLQRKNNGVEF